jgi:hypothetical protein
MTIGDGHDLRSARFAGDEILEGCYDNERVLQRGDSGSAVMKIQEALIFLGFPVPQVGANGIFGNETELAVRSYQEARGLSVDGIVGPETIGSLDEEFLTGAPETSVLPAPEPHVSEVPTPLFPESPVRTPRASPVGPVRAPEVHAPEVHAPEVHAPPVPVPEVPELATQVTPHRKRQPEVSRPAVTSRMEQIDSQGRKFHTAGTLSGNNSSFEVEAGKSVILEVTNLNVNESSIRIKTNTGEVKESVLLPDTPVDFEFSSRSEEPVIWKFNIETDSEDSLMEWKLYSD